MGSGWRWWGSELEIQFLFGVSLFHNVPFSESYDRGLIAINVNYQVIINKNFVESQNSFYLIKIFEGKEILLPAFKSYLPSLENLEKHRFRFGFNTKK